MSRLIVLILSFSMILCGCQESTSIPRPRSYPRVEFPAHAYTRYDTTGCPFTFDYPSFGEIRSKDKPCWFDIYMPVFNARLHCSYLEVKNRDDFDGMVDDVYTIASRINERANYMEETLLRNPQGIGGLTLRWTGPAASPVHFFLTDTTQHFFKAALYFDAKVQPDSLAPIVSYIQKDIDQMISSFAWKK